MLDNVLILTMVDLYSGDFMMKKLSVIIPHYNDSRRLKRCLDSIPYNDDIEVIVIDDNSDEEERRRSQDYVESRVCSASFFVNPNTNHSAGTCRNIGLDNASGEWILFADADDYFVNHWYEVVNQYFDSEYDIVFFNTTSVDESTGDNSDRHESVNQLVGDYLRSFNEKSELNLRYHHYVPWGKLIRRSVVQKNGIKFEEIRYSNDLMFCTKLGYCAERIQAVPKLLYCVTSSEGSLTHTKNIESFDTRKRAMFRRYAYLYHHLTKDEMRCIGMKYTGIRYVLSPIKNGYGLKLAIEYVRLAKSLGVSLIV